MLHRTSLALCMSVGVACRALGFPAPPRDKKELKGRFIELTKEHHPDQNASKAGGAEDTTARMIQVTEAYKTLKQLLDTGGAHATDVHGAVDALRRRQAGGGGGDGIDPSTAEVAASFVAPGASISMRGFSLPWQRGASRSKVYRLQDVDRAAGGFSFGEYTTAVRAIERERARTEAARRRDAAMADGSHGFTAEYFEQVNETKRRLRGGWGGGAADTARASTSGEDGSTATAGSSGGGATDDGLGRRIATGLVPLAVRFYGKQLTTAVRTGPRRCLDAVRFIMLGH